MMAELNVLLTAAQFFYSQVQKAKLNTEECRLLASHLLDIHKLISSQCKNNLSPELSHHLTGLAGYIVQILSLNLAYDLFQVYIRAHQHPRKLKGQVVA